jgi:hypothetical protein
MDVYTHIAYTWFVEFIETPLFTQLLAPYLGDDDYRELQRRLALDPEAGDVIPWNGRFSKAPLARHAAGQGQTRRPSSHLLLPGWRFADLAVHDVRQRRDRGPELK